MWRVVLHALLVGVSAVTCTLLHRSVTGSTLCTDGCLWLGVWVCTNVFERV